MINTPGTWPKKKQKSQQIATYTKLREAREHFCFNAEMVKLLEYRSTGDISNEATS